MARGPQGQKRKGDWAQVARQVLEIAVGEKEEIIPSGRRKSGLAGAEARLTALSSRRRKQIAKKAAESRWSKSRLGGNAYDRS
jgi:hypothetical protein